MQGAYQFRLLTQRGPGLSTNLCNETKVPYVLQLANIESSACKHRFFQLRLTDNIRGDLLGLSANELTLSANSLQTSGSTQIR